MTDEEAKALGLRALAAGFRWVPGCLSSEGRVVTTLGGKPVYLDNLERPPGSFGWQAYMDNQPSGGWPDFRDPATLGVLVGQVRERSGEPIHTAPCDDGAGGVYEWRAWPFTDLSRYWAGPTEAHALVAALERAIDVKGADDDR